MERANYLLYDTFHPDEPITKHLGLTQVIYHFTQDRSSAPFFQGGKGIPDADRMVQEIVPTHLSMSVIMIHRAFPCFAFFCFSMYFDQNIYKDPGSLLMQCCPHSSISVFVCG